MPQQQVGLPHFGQVVIDNIILCKHSPHALTDKPGFGPRGISGFKSAGQCLHLIASL
ncbi:MAG: hypothetical protein HY856_08300 [Burkholderiales bacterium]|nr:hypothetical protein [Burkholderiales bacterium]